MISWRPSIAFTSFHEEMDRLAVSKRVETAIREVIESGARTADLAVADDKVMSTTEMTEAILQELG